MTINLSEFVGKEVNVYFNENPPIKNTYVSSSRGYYHIKNTNPEYLYWNNGKSSFCSDLNITHIEFTKPMNQKQQLIQQIQSLEEQLKTTKEQLNNLKVKPEDSEVGDVLEDGSIVFLRGDNFIIVMADPECDSYGNYNERMVHYFSNKKWNERSIAGWFLPDANLMRRAMLVLPYLFKNDYYWTTTAGYNVIVPTKVCLWVQQPGVVRDGSVTLLYSNYTRVFKVIHWGYHGISV